MTDKLDLAGLQDIDDELGRVRRELAEVEAKIGPDAELEAMREQLRRLDTELLDVSRKEKALADEADSIGEKITTEEGRLYEGPVKFPKELAGLEQEIASLKARKSTLEDAALELLEQTSQLEAERAEMAAAESKLGRRPAGRTTDVERSSCESPGTRDHVAREAPPPDGRNRVGHARSL